MQKFDFEEAKLIVVAFRSEDVITTSNSGEFEGDDDFLTPNA